jgi:tRNA(Ile)-lysidine synthase
MLIEKVRQTIKDHNLIQKGDKIVLGISGGPDSVCLLHILNSLKDEFELVIYAAHLNHQIRGLQAQLDAKFVANLCEKMNIKYFIKSVDVPKFCLENSLSVEDGARKIRYEMFYEIKEKTNSSKIAIAHNLNDQAETILMRMMRGTGLQGLRGIEYKRDDIIIRPLLDISRKEIEDYCEEHDLSPRIDESNFEHIYTRNKIRLDLLPYMSENFNSNILNAIVRMGKNLSADYDFIEEYANEVFYKILERNNKESKVNNKESEVNKKESERDKTGIEINKNGVESNATYTKYNKYIEKESRIYNKSIDGEKITKILDEIYIPMDIYLQLHKAIKARVIRLALKYILGNTNNIDQVHIDDVMSLENSSKLGKRITLPKGINVYRQENDLFFTKKIISEQNQAEFCYNIPHNGFIKMNDINKIIKTEVMTIDKFRGTKHNKNSKAFDFDKIKGGIIIRNRKKGDKIKLSCGSKKLQDLFVDMKIPKQDRANIPVILDEQGVICVGEYRTSEDYKIDSNTKKVLNITFGDLYKR